MKRILFILSITLFIGCQEKKEAKSATSPAEQAVSEKKTAPLEYPEKVAQANGIDHWSKVKKLGFTFNVDRGDSHFERRWIWETKTNTITAKSSQDTLVYQRNAMDSIAQKTNGGFINDKFWLMMPFNLSWDQGNYTYTFEKGAKTPISGEIMDKLTVVYGSEGGYTPGDAYDLFIDADLKIKEWVFRKGNQPEASLTTTWEAYKTYGPLHLATSHKNEDGSFNLYFTDIVVE